MGALFAVLMGFLVRLFGQFALTKVFKIGLVLAFTTFFIASVSAYIQGCGLVISVVYRTMPEMVVGIWGWVMPPNTNACIIAIGSSYLLRFFTKLYFTLLNTRLLALTSS